MYYQKHQSERLSDAPIRKFTRFHNPKYKKNKCTILYRDNFVFVQPYRVHEENVEVQEETVQ